MVKDTDMGAIPPIKKSRRGGARPGAGRKRLALSERTRKRLQRAVNAEAKRTGKTPESVLANMIVRPGISTRDRLAAIALYYKVMLAYESHKTVEEHKYQGGLIILPEIVGPSDEEKKRIEAAPSRLKKRKVTHIKGMKTVY